MATKTPKISVIIPCYNVERYISRCLDSVCGQTLKDIEIICVDDCSTDNTLKIIQEYKKKDKRIILIKHIKNQGVSISRNDGIKKATGEYIGFVDSDDYIDDKFYEKLYNTAKQGCADIARGKLIFVQGKRKTEDNISNDTIKINKFNLYYGFTSCIYFNSLLSNNNIDFPSDLIYGEDAYFLLKAVANSKKITTMDDAYYYYVRRDDSADSAILSDAHFASALEFIKKSIEYMNNCQCSADEYVVAVQNKLSSLFGYMSKTKDGLKKHLIAITACETWRSVKYKNLFINNKYTQYLNNDDVYGLLSIMDPRVYILPLFVKQTSYNDIKYYLFGKISIFKIRTKRTPYLKDCYRLFNILPVLTIKKLPESKIGYLFSFVPAFKTKNRKLTKVDADTDKNKISVIVPVYKVEKYLKQCITAVCNQTHENLEIILVDDGSPDKCPKICDDLAKKDKRIRVIHKQNGGLSSARNAGLDIATGQYIFFVDSDDYIEPETLETMLTTMQSNSVDIVVAGVKPFYKGKDKPTSFDGMVGYFDTNDRATKLSSDKILNLPAVAWGKLYKKSIIDKYNMRFDVGLINEDESFNWYYNTKIRRGMFIPNKFYNYLIRNDSIMGNKQNNGDKIGDVLYIVDNVYEYLIAHNLLKKYDADFRAWAKSIIINTKNMAREFNNEKILAECDKRYAKYNKHNIIEFLTDDGYYKLPELLFSIKHSQDGCHKIICIFGIKIKYPRKK